MVKVSGLEPETYPLSRDYSNQLSYTSIFINFILARICGIEPQSLDLESNILPIEIYPYIWRMVSDSNRQEFYLGRLAIYCNTVMRTNHIVIFYYYGGSIWT
jgi:hypothetical protein